MQTYFSQKDPRWAGMLLGSSPYAMGPYGCLTTCHAQAMQISGWDIDPGCAVTALTAAGAYTGSDYPAGPGLLLWYKVASAFPQYRFGSGDTGRFRFVQAIATYASGRFEHWVLNVHGDPNFYDPIDGTYGPMKPNYRPTGTVRSADIDGNAAVRPFPKDVSVTAGALRYRRQASLSSPALGQYQRGKVLSVTEAVRGEPVSGNDLWLSFELNGETLRCWSGGTDYQPN